MIENYHNPEGSPLDVNALIREIVREELKANGTQILAEVAGVVELSKAPRTYTRSQVCEILKCSKPTYHRLAKAGAFTVLKRGGAVLILADDFDARFKAGKIAKYQRF